MLRINYLKSLKASYDMLKCLDGQEVCTRDIKKVKATRNEKTCCFDTLLKLKVLKKTKREEPVKITLPSSEVIETTRYYYKVDVSKFDKVIKKVEKSNHDSLVKRINKLENELAKSKELLAKIDVM